MLCRAVNAFAACNRTDESSPPLNATASFEGLGTPLPMQTETRARVSSSARSIRCQVDVALFRCGNFLEFAIAHQLFVSCREQVCSSDTLKLAQGICKRALQQCCHLFRIT